MEIQPVSIENLHNLIELVLELWPGSDFEEESENYKAAINS
jgi:hypothetical protein